MKKNSCVLVCFTRRSGSEILDIQYHAFDNCPDSISFVHDPLFKSFVSSGYTWSSLYFPVELAYSCGFTISDCEVNDLYVKE